MYVMTVVMETESEHVRTLHIRKVFLTDRSVFSDFNLLTALLLIREASSSASQNVTSLNIASTLRKKTLTSS